METSGRISRRTIEFGQVEDSRTGRSGGTPLPNLAIVVPLQRVNSAAIGIAPVCDGHDLDDKQVVEDAVDDPVLTAAGRIQWK